MSKYGLTLMHESFKYQYFKCLTSSTSDSDINTRTYEISCCAAHGAAWTEYDKFNLSTQAILAYSMSMEGFTTFNPIVAFFKTSRGKASAYFLIVTHLRRLACGSVSRGEGVLAGREAVDCARIAHMVGTEISRGNNKCSQVHNYNFNFVSRLPHCEALICTSY